MTDVGGKRSMVRGRKPISIKLDEPDSVQRFRAILPYYTNFRAEGAARLLLGYRAARKTCAAAQQQTADEFNLLEVMNVHRDEVRHSKILAWLLDHRPQYGTHAQGNLGFRLFLEELRSDLGLTPANFQRLLRHLDEDLEYWVATEVAGDESRVDIEIAARDKILIHIENKIHSIEGDDQTHREGRDFECQRLALHVPWECSAAIFLTLDGASSRNSDFHPVGWSRIAAVFNRFADEAKPPDVKLFARHYANAIRKMCSLNASRGG
jgi:HSP20 family molecular chaperone IbpA